MQSELSIVSHDVNGLKAWRIATEAVEAYKRTEKSNRSSRINSDIAKNIGLALSIIAALVAALLNVKGLGGL